jgi:putative ATP-dependent endonuclease of OLD family
MRLESVRVQNYRSCYDTTISLSHHLTLLVGENDAGKSNLIDAIRMSVPPVSGRATLWFETDRDVSYGAEANVPIAIKRTYGDLTDSEDAFYTPALVDPHRKLIHTTHYLTDPTLARRHRLQHSVGENCVADPEPENRDRIAHVYLQPLRDAATALDSAGGNRLAEIFRIIASQEEITEFEDKANVSLEELAADQTAKKVISRVQTHLTAVTQPVRHRIVDVQHRNQRLASLTRSLRLHMAAEGLTPSDLRGSGLGYANLLFIATVVLELERASDCDLLLLLVEEPEAHLHPQLQSVLLSYLEDQARQSATQTVEDGSPAGRIQVIATTHSPYLASSLSTQDIVVVRSCQRAPEGGGGLPSAPTDEPAEADTKDNQEPPEVPVPVPHAESVAVSLSSMALSAAQRRKVDRYLDATRASLLFARQIVLVEGVAEALLLRTLAERVVYPIVADVDTDAGHLNRRLREQFRAISVVPIGGVDFTPYLKLLFHEDLALADRVVVVTDGDGGAGEDRRHDLTQAFQGHVESGCLSIMVGGTTLEAELFALPANEGVLRHAFETQHPRSLAKWDAIMPQGQGSAAERATAFSAALRAGSLDLGKGDFAQVVAELIVSTADADQFQVPDYLKDAIRNAVIEPSPETVPEGENAGG